jgi:phosphoribosylamine--glycine ligase
MNVLLIGSGGREHALAWRLVQSPRLSRLFAAPGNPGIAAHATLVAINPADHAAVTAFCRREKIELVVVGPEQPLVDGLVDALEEAGIRAFGPSKAAAQLEGSKSFTKQLCEEAGIPTALGRTFTDAAAAAAYVRATGAPIVVKADGLAAGKGVTVAATIAEAIAAVEDCFAGTHGAAGAKMVIEECLAGEEVSFFALSDGTNVVPFGSAQDHKRAGDHDTGPNTGGMGAYSPTPAMTEAMNARVMNEIIRPTVSALAMRGTPFRGVLFAGIMLTASGPKLIEYNVRFGDPECQVLLMRLQSDLLEAILATVESRLLNVKLHFNSDAALTVVMAAKGYPGRYSRGDVVSGIENAEMIPGVKVFHAGTAMKDGKLIANGGRVLNVTARGRNVVEAQARAYEAVNRIGWPGGFCRHDIGWRAVERTKASA